MVCKLRDEYHWRRKHWGEQNFRTLESKRAWDLEKDQYYGGLPPERRAQELLTKVQTKEAKRAKKIKQYNEARETLKSIDEELAEVARRKDATVHGMRGLQAEIADLGAEIAKAKTERAEVLRIATMEAQGGAVAPEVGRTEETGGGSGHMAHPSHEDFLRMAIERRGQPGVQELLQAAARAGMHIPGWGKPSGPANGGAWNGQQAGQMKRNAGVTPPRGGGSDMDSVVEEEWDRDLFGIESAVPHQMWDARPQDPPTIGTSKGAHEEALRLVQQGARCWETAPNQGGWRLVGTRSCCNHRRRLWSPPPMQALQAASPPAGRSMPRRCSPAARRGRSPGSGERRRRSASRSVVGRAEFQQRHREAVAQYIEHCRQEIAHGQAAAALVQRAPERAPQPVTPVVAPEPLLSQPAATRRESPSMERCDEVPVDDRSEASGQFCG